MKLLNHIKLFNKVKIILILVLLFFIPAISSGYIFKSFDLTAESGYSDGIIIADFHNNENFMLKKNIASNDTTTTNNSIKNIYGRDDVYSVVINLENDDSEIRLSVFNMLAKEIKLIYNGIHTRGEDPYIFNVSNLSPGIYFCVLQGKNFRDVEKFVISR